MTREQLKPSLIGGAVGGTIVAATGAFILQLLCRMFCQ